MKNYSVKLAFHDWIQSGKSVYRTEAGVELSSGSFHSGTVFIGTLFLDEEEYQQLKKALAQDYQPIFCVFDFIECE